MTEYQGVPLHFTGQFSSPSWWNINEIREEPRPKSTELRHCLICTFLDSRADKAKSSLIWSTHRIVIDWIKI